MKFSFQRIFTVASLIVAITFGLFANANRTYAHNSQQAATTGRLRLIHAVPDAPAVDVTIDGALSAHNLEFGSATRHLLVPSGDHAIVVSAGGKSVYKGKVTVAPEQALSVVLQGTAATVEAGTYEEELGPVAPGKIRLNAINAMKDSDGIDIMTSDGNLLIPGLKYNSPYGGFDIAAGTMSLAAVPAGTTDVSAAVAKTDATPLVAGTYNVFVVLGTQKGKASSIVLSTAVDADQPASSAMVRFVHAASGAKAVDVYVGDTLIAPALDFGVATPHIALDPKGAVSIRAAGSTDKTDLLSLPDLGVAAGSAATIVISAGADGKLKATVAADNVTALDPKTARVNVINATGAGVATLKVGGKSLVTDATKGTVLGEVPSGVYAVTGAVDKPAITLSDNLTLDGGVLYDVIVSGDAKSGKLIVGTTGINEQPGSAASGESSTVAQADTPSAPASTQEAAVEATTEATTETAASTAVEATQEAPAATPTLAPAAVTPTIEPTTVPQPTEDTAGASSDVVTAVPTATEAPPQETVAPQPTVFEGYLGTVYNLNEGAHLKLREYPTADSKPLYLLNRDDSVVINGIKGKAAVAGQPTAKPTTGPTPTISAEGVDPNTIWLYVTFQAQDGGTITGWVNMQYIKVIRKGREVKDLVEILSLRQYPANLAGELNTSAATPISEANQIMGTVQVNEGTNLQLRRTPDISGESLALLPSGAQVVVIYKTEVASKGGLVGEPKSTIWLWVQYKSDSGNVTGWINSQYVVLTRNGRKWDIKDIPATKDQLIGDKDAGVAPVSAPPAAGLVATVDKLNPGANLQMRRDPDAAAESLSLVPAGSQLVIVGRNEDGNWLRVQFEGNEGWINSQFVSVTRNGKKYDIALLTNVSGKKDIIGTITPGPSPTATQTPKP